MSSNCYFLQGTVRTLKSEVWWTVYSGGDT